MELFQPILWKKVAYYKGKILNWQINLKHKNIEAQLIKKLRINKRKNEFLDIVQKGVWGGSAPQPNFWRFLSEIVFVKKFVL